MKIKYLLFILLTIIISSCSNENNKLVIKDNCDFYVIGVERKTLHHTRTLSIGYDENYYVYYIGTSPISNDTVFIISGENNSSKGNNLPEQLYKIGDKFKLLKQNN